MAKKKADKTQENIQAVEQALSKTELFLERNQKLILYIIIGILVLFGGYFGYGRYIKLPKMREAQERMFIAEKYFEKDSLNLALNGDGLNFGFLDIIDNYRRTPAGNLSRFYAGAIYLKLGEFDNAIDHLERFKAKDPMVGPTAIRMLGDAYLELNEPLKAIDYYLKAAKEADNDLLSPEFLMRAGKTYELIANYEKALDTYNKIKRKYPNSHRGQNVDKYIGRTEAIIKHSN